MQAYIRTEIVLAEPATVSGLQGFYVTPAIGGRTFVPLDQFVIHYRPAETRELALLKSTEAELGVSRISDTNHPCTDDHGRHKWVRNEWSNAWDCVNCGAETFNNPLKR